MSDLGLSTVYLRDKTYIVGFDQTADLHFICVVLHFFKLVTFVSFIFVKTIV